MPTVLQKKKNVFFGCFLSPAKIPTFFMEQGTLIFGGFFLRHQNVQVCLFNQKAITSLQQFSLDFNWNFQGLVQRFGKLNTFTLVQKNQDNLCFCYLCACAYLIISVYISPEMCVCLSLSRMCVCLCLFLFLSLLTFRSLCLSLQEVKITEHQQKLFFSPFCSNNNNTPTSCSLTQQL